MAHPRFSSAKDRSIVTIGVTAALLSLPLAAPIVAAAAGSPLQPLQLEKAKPVLGKSQPLDVRPVSRPVAVVDKATGQLVNPKTGKVIDRTKAVLDPATGKLIDPLSGAIIPSDVPALPPLADSPAPAAKSKAAAPRKALPPAPAPAIGPLPAPQPAPAGDGNGLLPPADQMVTGVVDEVLGASSDESLQPLIPLLGDRKTSDDANSLDDASSGSLSDDSVSARSGPAVPVSSDDARTVGLASGSGAVEVQPGALASASMGGTSGVPHLLGVSALSGLRSLQSYLSHHELEAPQVSTPAGFDDSTLAAADALTTSERQITAGQVTATSLPGVVNEAPSWLVSTASGLLLVVGGTSVAYGTRRLRRRNA